MKAATEDTNDIANGCAFGRSDKADAAGEQRQRFLARGIEKAFAFEAFFQLVESELQRAKADRLDRLDVNLIFTTLLVNANAAAHGDFEAVLGAELDAALLLFEDYAADLGAVVL